MKHIRLFESWRQKRKYQLLLESVISLDENLVKHLNSIKEEGKNEIYVKICDYILNAIGNNLPKNRFDRVNSTSEDPTQLDVVMGKQTTKMKIGKVIRGLLSSLDINVGQGELKEDIFGKFIDELVGKIKTQKVDTFEMVSGDKIAFYYDRDNTVKKPGTELFGSCMAGASKGDLLNIYTENPNSVQLLVKKVGDLADARALVWKLAYSEDGFDYFMDRCYTNSKSDEEPMFVWLKENKGKVDNFLRTGSGLNIVKLDKVLHKFYPYIDTFGFLHIRKVDGKLVDEGILTNKQLKKDPGHDDFFDAKIKKIDEQIIAKLGTEYKWLEDENNYVSFKCKSTRGLRESQHWEERDFQNEQKKILVKGYKFKVLDEKPLDTFRTVRNILTIMKRNPDITALFDFVPIDTPSPEMVEGNDGIYFDANELIDSFGEKYPKPLCVKIYEVSSLYNDGTKVKTRKGSIPFKKIFDYLSISGKTWGGVDEYNPVLNNENGKFLSELDLHILGIQDLVKDVEPSYVLLDKICMSSKFNEQTEYLKRLMGLEDKDEKIGIRKLMGSKLGDEEFADKGFFSFLKGLKKNE